MMIQTNTAANTAFRNLTNTSDMLNSSIQRLSSGFRINRSADDVAGQAVANALRSEGRALGAAQRNATQANAVLNVADGALAQVGQIVDRMRELAVQAGSANSSTADRTNLATEFNGLRSEIGRIVQETTYQGTQLLNGTFNAAFRVGTGTGAIITAALNLTGGLTATGLGISASSISSAASAATALGVLSSAGTAMTRINNMAGRLGAAQNRLGFAMTTLSARVENVRAAESVVRDLNVAQEMTNFSRLQILQQAGTAMLAQANSAPQSVLSLLRG